VLASQLTAHLASVSGDSSAPVVDTDVVWKVMREPTTLLRATRLRELMDRWGWTEEVVHTAFWSDSIAREDNNGALCDRAPDILCSVALVPDASGGWSWSQTEYVVHCSRACNQAAAAVGGQIEGSRVGLHVRSSYRIGPAIGRRNGQGTLDSELYYLFRCAPVLTRNIRQAGIMDDDVGDNREERALRLWINSMGLQSKPGKDGIVRL